MQVPYQFSLIYRHHYYSLFCANCAAFILSKEYKVYITSLFQDGRWVLTDRFDRGSYVQSSTSNNLISECNRE